jgi:hypothetical protein
MEELRVETDQWRPYYNYVRLHSFLGYMPHLQRRRHKFLTILFGLWQLIGERSKY